MPPTDKPVSRREFTRRAVAGAASATVLPLRELLLRAATSETAQPAQTPASGRKLSPQGQAEAEARFQAILQQYPDRFSDAQKTDLRRLCVSAQPPLDRIRAYAVGNSDLPALYLKPLVDRDKKPVAASGSIKPAANSAPLSSGATKSPATSRKP